MAGPGSQRNKASKAPPPPTCHAAPAAGPSCLGAARPVASKCRAVYAVWRRSDSGGAAAAAAAAATAGRLTSLLIMQAHKAGRKAGLSAREKHRNTKGAWNRPPCPRLQLLSRTLHPAALAVVASAPVRTWAADARYIFTVCLTTVMQTIKTPEALLCCCCPCAHAWMPSLPAASVCCQPLLACLDAFSARCECLLPTAACMPLPPAAGAE